MRWIKDWSERLLESESQESLNKELLNAAMYGSPAAVEAVLDRGAEINSADRLGMAALHWAALNGNETVIKMLLHRGADPNLGDMKGTTPFRTLIRTFKHHSLRSRDLNDIVKFFIGYGADPCKAFKSFDDFKYWFGGDLSWYRGDLPALQRRFKATEIRRKLF